MSESKGPTDIEKNPFLNASIEEEVEVRAVRSEGKAPTLEGIKNPESDIIQLELTDGLTWITTPKKYDEDYPGAVQVDDGSYTFDLPKSDTSDVDRGILKSGWKFLRRIAIERGAEKTALAVAQKLESSLQPGAGLYRIENPTKILGPAEPDDFVSGEPSLVFIHGTGSNTEGSFMPLVLPATEETDTLDFEYWNSLVKSYKGRVFALEHETLSKSPLYNACKFLESVPHGANIHLVSHSRGGLVGEILSRANIHDRTRAFNDDELGIFQRALKEADNRDRKEAILEEMRLIHKVNELFGQKQINVDRFVRVACPASGTNLMTKRADVFLNILLNAIGLIPPLKASGAYDFLTAFLMQVVEERFKPEVLPGLSAQQPGSPLVRALNNPNVKIDAELSVISGSASFSNILKKLVVFVSKLVFWEKNDLVVHTRSMYGGAERTKSWVYFKDDSRNISHFRYFKNQKPRLALTQGLDEPSSQGIMENIDEDVRTRKRGITKQGGQPIDEAPVVFVLPGIMGSVLSVEDKDVWVNPGAIMWGGIRKIAIGSESVTPSGMLERFYGDLIQHLGEKNHVIPFPFDWRIAIAETAERLGQDVEKTLETTDQRISFMAHSMGGLVVRKMIALRPDLWKRIIERGGRLVMLGTPNQGSYSVIRTLVGENKLIKYLALLDVKNTQKEILKIISQYDGFLEMLPLKSVNQAGDKEVDVNYFDKDQWEALKKAQSKAMLPTVGRLNKAKKFREDLDESTLDPAHMVYVAGRASATAASIRVSGKKLEFMATSKGDGTVTWSSGIAGKLEDVTYYMPADHGSMPACRSAFPALQDLLERGKTNRLSKQPPVVRGEEDEQLTVLDPVEVEFLPDDDWLQDIAVGREEFDLEVPQDKVQVSVSMGNLSHAAFPVVVGHYEGDAIVHAESALNWQLDRRLSHFHDMGIYPGEPETSLVVLNENNTPCGGIVIGLGKFGELSQDKLLRSLQHGLISYAMRLCQSRKTEDEQLDEYDPEATETIGISPLIIGAGPFSSLSIRSSIRSILIATQQVNAKIEQFNTTNNDRILKPISEIEFIEIYEDRAIQIMHTVHEIVGDELARHFEIKDVHIRTREGARKRFLDQNPDWWYRIKIEHVKEEPRDASDEAIEQAPALSFVSLTGRARAEESTTFSNLKLIHALLNDGQIPADSNGKIAKALFELLLPNAFKDFLMDRHNLVLVVDDEAAAFPWEMLASGGENEHEPIVLRGGMIRQLVTENFRQEIDTPMENSALIIGDPISDKIELDAARDEARMVQEMLEKSDFDVTPLVREDASPQATISTLFNSRFRVLHLAGHGVFKEGPEEETGMVLGKDLILTPGTIKQLSHVPELVFINCCYLGKVAPDDDSRKNRHLIAANLGTELIRMGVRCVVAAGWEVEDNAAKEFAEVFYDCMLRGMDFGEAVKQARVAIYDPNALSNTWGAYQCYGDPYYNLVKDRKASHQDLTKYVYPEEAIVDLANLVSKATNAEERRYFKILQGELFRTIDCIPDVWLSEARVVEAIAQACGELEMYDEAIEYYRGLSNLEEASFSFDALEVQANLEARSAFLKWNEANGDTKKKEQARKTIKGALEFLSYITDTQVRFTTANRCSLVGSACKRQAAMLSRTDDRKKSLVKARDYYKKAYDIFLDRDRIHHYSGLNWLTIEAILGAFYPGDALLNGAFGRVLSEIEKELKTAKIKDPSFWNISGQGDLQLFKYLQQMLHSGGADEEILHDKKKRAIIDAYMEAWRRGGTYKKKNSILEQFTWLIALIDVLDAGLTVLSKNGKKGSTVLPISSDVSKMCIDNLKDLKVSLTATLST